MHRCWRRGGGVCWRCLRHVRFLSLMDPVPLGRSGKRRRITAALGSEPLRASACLRGKSCLSRSPHAPSPLLGGRHCPRCCYATAQSLLEAWSALVLRRRRSDSTDRRSAPWNRRHPVGAVKRSAGAPDSGGEARGQDEARLQLQRRGRGVTPRPEGGGR